MVVSHDRHLLGLIADRLVLVDDGTAWKEFDGSLDEYRDLVLGVGESRAGGRGKSTAQPDRKGVRRLAAEASNCVKALCKVATVAEAEPSNCGGAGMKSTLH